MRKFIQRADEPFFFDRDGVPQIPADEAGCIAVIGDRMHVTLFEMRPAFVDGVLQDRLKAVACIMMKVDGAISVNERARRVLEPLRIMRQSAPIWLGEATNRPLH